MPMPHSHSTSSTEYFYPCFRCFFTANLSKTETTGPSQVSNLYGTGRRMYQAPRKVLARAQFQFYF